MNFMEILIQKFCYCCDNRLLKIFEHYLLDKNFVLPNQLIASIRKHPKESIHFYCKSVYGNTSSESIKKFNQLSYHTLRLSHFISQNFPSFLSSTITEIEWLIFNNKKNEALFLHQIASDVAHKIEDYKTLIQLHHLSDKLPVNSKTDNHYLNNLQSIEQLLEKQNDLIHQITMNKYIPKAKDLSFFKNFFTSKSKSVSILAKQSFLNVLSTGNSKTFYKNETLALIKSTIKQVENNSFLQLMQHKEKIMNLDYMLLKHTLSSFDDKKVDQYNSKIINKWSNFYSDNTTLEMSMLFALSIKGSYYATRYYAKEIPTNTQQEIADIVEMCKSIHDCVLWENEGYLKYINFCNVYAIYLVLNRNEKEAIAIIERVLHEYQQKQFKKLIDQLFVVLIMAYYKAKDYDAVADTYHRYKKQSNSAVSIIENELILQSIYYLAQIKNTERKQYHQKLDAVIQTLKADVKLKENLNLVLSLKAQIIANKN